VIPLTFTLVEQPQRAVDMSVLIPERLRGKTPQEIGRMKLICARRRIAVGDLFKIEGEDVENLRIHRAGPAVHGIGRRMGGGSIGVSGTVGEDLGREMCGGSIRLKGDAGGWVGGAMRGGRIEVSGNVGDFLAAGPPGESAGMRGGSIRVGGRAGDRAGDRVRRGFVLIEGDCGDYCASRMLAGTLVVLGRAGRSPGLGMRRGTLLLGSMPASIPATFNDGGPYEAVFLELLYRYGAQLSRRFRAAVRHRPGVHRWVGDLGSLGKGELLVFE
jgi:formylmethanofuran dehydrogenase subunit C